MQYKGEEITAKGRCLACGKKLMKGDLCFDCRDTHETKRETYERVVKIQQSLHEENGECAMKPIEDEDYYVQHGYHVHIDAHGSAFVWAFEDDFCFDKLREQIYKNIDWHDMNIHGEDKTRHTRKVKFNGEPFDEREWLKEKLSKVGKKAVGDQVISVNQRTLQLTE